MLLIIASQKLNQSPICHLIMRMEGGLDIFNLVSNFSHYEVQNALINLEYILKIMLLGI
jgi:hypothetical protein